MFKAVLEVQWKLSRVALLLATIAGFILPVASMRLGVENARTYDTPAFLIEVMTQFGAAYSAVAAGIGLAMALFAWSADHRGRHVYALSLPVTRAHYALMRFGSGMLFLLLPSVAVLVGSLVAAGMTVIPPGLHVYPIALAIRFFLASGVAFSLFFAVSSSTTRAAAVVLGTIGAIIVIGVVLSAAQVPFDLFGKIGNFLLFSPGVLSVFSGRWMLVDA